MKTRKPNEDELLDIKVNHVLGCFTDYLYHKHASDTIQEELNWISSELSAGSTSNGIIKVSKDSRGANSPWENELLAREHELIQEQNKHEEALDLVDQWIASIKSDKHREIVVEYLINNLKTNVESVAEACYTTPGNVSKTAMRIVANIARKIS